MKQPRLSKGLALAAALFLLAWAVTITVFLIIDGGKGFRININIIKNGYIDQAHYTGRVESGQARRTFYYALYEYENVNGRVLYIQPRDSYLREEQAQRYGELNPTIDILTDGESYLWPDTSKFDVYIGYIGPSMLMIICYVLSGLCFWQMAKAIRWAKEMKARENNSVGQQGEQIPKE